MSYHTIKWKVEKVQIDNTCNITVKSCKNIKEKVWMTLYLQWKTIHMFVKYYNKNEIIFYNKLEITYNYGENVQYFILRILYTIVLQVKSKNYHFFVIDYKIIVAF